MSGLCLAVVAIVCVVVGCLWCTCSARGNRLVSIIKHVVLKLPISQSVAESHMNHLRATLGACQIPFFLTEGTALGAIREHRIIPHDTDIDIGIDIEYRQKFKACAAPLFRKLGFKSYRHSDTFLTLIKDYLYIDIMFMGHTGTCVDISCQQMRRYHNNRIKATLYGQEYDCLPVEFIEELYGPDWRTPKREKPEQRRA